MRYQMFPDALIRKICFFGDKAAEKRNKVIDALDGLRDKIGLIAHQPISQARGILMRRMPEAAKDVFARERWIERLAVNAIAGTSTIEDVEAAIGSYLFSWHRAQAAVELWELTCRNCRSIRPSVVLRDVPGKTHGYRICIPCWKAASARPWRARVSSRIAKRVRAASHE